MTKQAEFRVVFQDFGKHQFRANDRSVTKISDSLEIIRDAVAYYSKELDATIYGPWHILVREKMGFVQPPKSNTYVPFENAYGVETTCIQNRTASTTTKTYDTYSYLLHSVEE